MMEHTVFSTHKSFLEIIFINNKTFYMAVPGSVSIVTNNYFFWNKI